MTTLEQAADAAAFRQKIRRARIAVRRSYAPLSEGWAETKEALGHRTAAFRTWLVTAPPLAKLLLYGIPILFIVALPQLPFVSAFYRTALVDRVAFYVLLALGLNIVVGFAGLLDLGYVAFYAIGAYTAAIMTGAGPIQPPFLLDPFLTFPVAILIAMAAGVLLGLPTLRLRGDYLAIVTLGFHEIVRITLKNSDPITNGDRGISAIPQFAIPAADADPRNYLVFLLVVGGLIAAYGLFRLVRRRGDRLVSAVIVGAGALLAVFAPALAGSGDNEGPMTRFGQRFADFGLDPIPYYYLALVICALMVFIVYRLSESRVGRAWVAIREDEIAAEAMGVPTLKMKVWAFALGASTAGFAGVMLAIKTSFINPQYFLLLQSIIVLAMVVFGGMGSIAGAIAGAVFIGFTTEALRDFDVIPFGAIFTAVGFGMVIAGALIAVNVIKTRTGRPYGIWLLVLGAFIAVLALARIIQRPFLLIAQNPENWRLFILGLIIMVVMIVRPQGLIPSRRRAAELHGDAVAAGEALATSEMTEAEEDDQVLGKVDP